jgi:SAM-dependent methyltransferase
MLNIANVRANDLVIDLGSGDGRIAIAAGKRGAQALGIEIDPKLINESTTKAAARLENRVRFRQQDLFKTSLAEATVITLYLHPDLDLRLRSHLLALRPGTRIVSHQFAMGDWKPDLTDTDGGTVYLWIIPAQVDGLWQGRYADQAFQIQIKQRYQEISGTARLAGAEARIRDGRVRGNEIEFSIDVSSQITRFKGTASGDSMQGSQDVAASGRQAINWSAVRR